MKNGRIMISRHGGPEVLEAVTQDLRNAGPGEVRIRVLAAGVSWADCMMRRGSYPSQPKLPFTPGYDIVGVVEQLGPGTESLEPGQMVASLTVHGGYSQFVFRPASELVPVPAGLDPAAAVCLVLNYTTAYQMLHRYARVKERDRILVHSAAGGVGTAVLQLGRLRQLEMFGTASPAKLDLVSRLDCRAIDYKNSDFVNEVRALAPGGVDLVLDSIGGRHWLRSSECLRRGGLLVAYGSQNAILGEISRKLEDVACVAFLAVRPGRRFSFYSITAVKKQHPDWFREDLSLLFTLLSEGRIQPLIADRMPWTQAAEAHRRLEEGRAEGKLVLVFD